MLCAFPGAGSDDAKFSGRGCFHRDRLMAGANPKIHGPAEGQRGANNRGDSIRFRGPKPHVSGSLRNQV